MMQIKGINAVFSMLDRLGREAEKITKESIQKIVDKMVSDARSKAPRDLGRLIDSIDSKRVNDGWTIVFFASEPHAAFQEFGTGSLVSVPEELKNVASEFRGYKSGNFSEFLKNISEWCVRHGIPENAAYPIALKILNVGLKPQPFFYPAYMRHRGDILPTIENKIRQCITRINR